MFLKYVFKNPGVFYLNMQEAGGFHFNEARMKGILPYISEYLKVVSLQPAGDARAEWGNNGALGIYTHCLPKTV